ncbi:MAG: 50S ribosome-binding GTPase [Melioribacteraceae bacterium]|nr:50S ribosome-binding GTPase [Melioribacteraceae bacterium]
MPANLPPEYHEAERRYKEADSPQEKVETLEALISTIPKHKGTDKLRADLRKKLSKYKSQAQSSKRKTGKHETHFHIEKEGNARVVVLGAANVGKSSLVANLTHADPEISESPFSTWTPVPGMVVHNGVHIQLIDTPALDRDYMEPEFVDLIKHSDLVLLMIDLQAFPIQQFQKSIDILESHNICPIKHDSGLTDKKIHKLPYVVVANKDDAEKLDEDFNVLNELLREEGFVLLPVSVKTGRNIHGMMNFIIKELMIIRVYSKKPHEEPDYSRPFILRKGATIDDFAMAVHKDFHENMKNARIWGNEVHEGQVVSREHLLCDGDVVELHI